MDTRFPWTIRFRLLRVGPLSKTAQAYYYKLGEEGGGTEEAGRRRGYQLQGSRRMGREG
jgi:hypothetical protein